MRVYTPQSSATANIAKSSADHLPDPIVQVFMLKNKGSLGPPGGFHIYNHIYIYTMMHIRR